jgi:nucleotide-binding universal stress UspA family protein
MEVLVYVDPSPRGEWALSVAAELPTSWASSFCLLATAEDVRAEPNLLARAAARLGGRTIRQSVADGPAERAVVAEALAGSYGLLVVPPAGRGAIARMIKGSRVATLVRSVRAPVLVARRPPQRFERVLAALSGGPSTRTVSRAALSLARALGARVAFLHVVSEVALPFHDQPRTAAEGGDSPPSVAEIRKTLRHEGASEDLLIREGLLVEEVLDVFEEGAYQLLVVGGRGEEEVGHGQEDVTERLLLSCPASTLVVQAGSAHGT